MRPAKRIGNCDVARVLGRCNLFSSGNLQPHTKSHESYVELAVSSRSSQIFLMLICQWQWWSLAQKLQVSHWVIFDRLGAPLPAIGKCAIGTGAQLKLCPVVSRKHLQASIRDLFYLLLTRTLNSFPLGFGSTSVSRYPPEQRASRSYIRCSSYY